MAVSSSLPGARAMAFVFAVLITVPGIGLALGFGRGAVSEAEMRELTPWPGWPRAGDSGALRRWFPAAEQYFNDHFALRAQLITWRSAALWRWLRTSGFDNALAGRDGWLFYADDGSVEDWVQEEPFPAEELADWETTLVKRRAFLERRGIPYLFVIAPDKQMVYPEFMPQSLKRLRPDFRVDQLVAHMRRAVPDFEILDLREALSSTRRARGDEEVLYHRFDTHWNDRGALVAYQAMAARLRQWFPALVPLTRQDFDTDPAVPSGDRTSMLGLMDEGKTAMPGLVLRRGAGYRVVAPARPNAYGEDPILFVEHANKTLPTALVFRDSFGARLIPYLSEHFRRVEYYWQNELDYEEIDRQRPDIVIQIFTARHFFTYGPYPPEIPE